MKAALQAVARAAGLAPAEPRSAALAGKATRLRERAVAAEDRANGLGVELAAARARFDLEVAEEVEDGPAKVEVQRLVAALATVEDEQRNLLRLAARFDAQSRAAAEEERAEGEERHLRALARLHGEKSREATEALAKALVLASQVDTLSRSWGLRYERWARSGGAILTTDGLDLYHILEAAYRLTPTFDETAHMNNGRATEVRFPAVDVPELEPK